MSKTLHLPDFKSQMKKTFQVYGESEGVVKITLVEAVDKSREGIEAFSLVFKGPKEPALKQMTYKMKQNKLGEFKIFLVPIVSGETEAVLYQSIFNRKAEAK